MANLIELLYEDQDPETGKVTGEMFSLPLWDDTIHMSSTEDGKHQMYIYSSPESQDAESPLIEGIFFRFKDDDMEEIYHIPQGLDLDRDNLVDIFGEERMEDLNIVSLSTQ